MTDSGYEKSEPRMGLVALAFGGIMVALILVVLALQGFYDRAREQQIFVQVLQPVSEDLVNLRAKEDGQLHSYQYLDRAAGTVRIPIERAMELLEKEAAEGRLSYPAKPAPVKPQGVPNAN
ncbi:MAG: hypothetical protein HY822_14170 [Acidobacteria bacterium]|nr:hypothetical protein [Acidobacteriota bacterium]